MDYLIQRFYDWTYRSIRISGENRHNRQSLGLMQVHGADSWNWIGAERAQECLVSSATKSLKDLGGFGEA